LVNLRRVICKLISIPQFYTNLHATSFNYIIYGIINFNWFCDYYIYKKIKNEYIRLGITYIEWNGQSFDWENAEEIRIKKENGKPMFLILRVSGEYHKIPLRLFAEQIDMIIEHIKSLDLNITE